MKTQRLTIALVLAPLILVGCGGGDGASSGASTDPADLAGTWVLDAATIGSLSADAPSDAPVTVTFSDGQASGSAGCNTFSGSYEAADDGTLTFGPLASTMMACEEPLMTLESAYFGAMDAVTSFSVDGVALTLSGDGETLSYTAESGS